MRLILKKRKLILNLPKKSQKNLEKINGCIQQMNLVKWKVV